MVGACWCCWALRDVVNQDVCRSLVVDVVTLGLQQQARSRRLQLQLLEEEEEKKRMRMQVVIGGGGGGFLGGFCFF